MMVAKEKNALSTKWGAAAYTFGGDSGSTKTGFLENSVTTPYGGPAVGSPALIGGCFILDLIIWRIHVLL
jgi:hypothetical protein